MHSALHHFKNLVNLSTFCQNLLFWHLQTFYNLKISLSLLLNAEVLALASGTHPSALEKKEMLLLLSALHPSAKLVYLLKLC